MFYTKLSYIPNRDQLLLNRDNICSSYVNSTSDSNEKLLPEQKKILFQEMTNGRFTIDIFIPALHLGHRLNLFVHDYDLTINRIVYANVLLSYLSCFNVESFNSFITRV